jgi:hypothetical protein
VRKTKAVGLGGLILMLAAPAWARDDRGAVTVSLSDGSTLVGTIVQEDEAELTVRTRLGLEVRVPRSAVASVQAAGDDEGRGFRADPAASRLLFAPTGRPLGKGEGYFSDHYVLFPGATAGVTDHFSLGGGMSMVPGLGFSEQVFYVAPRLAWSLTDKAAVSTGVLYARAGEYQAAVAFGMGTFGPPDASVTVGLGMVATRDDEGGGFELRRAPILVVGGSKRLSQRLALISENWLFLGEGFRLSSQPFGLGLRFLGDRLSADVGLILIGDVLANGFPVPWLSFSYHFPDRGRLTSSARGRRR